MPLCPHTDFRSTALWKIQYFSRTYSYSLTKYNELSKYLASMESVHRWDMENLWAIMKSLMKRPQHFIKTLKTTIDYIIQHSCIVNDIQH